MEADFWHHKEEITYKRHQEFGRNFWLVLFVPGNHSEGSKPAKIAVISTKE